MKKGKQDHLVFVQWNGWTYVKGKRSYWKERHNPNFKNFREKVKSDDAEFSEAATKYAEAFKSK